MTAIHQAAAQGFASQADTYARGRPEYPAEIDTWLRGTLGLSAGRTVLDLGAGTGRFTRRLVETGATVIAVEPVAQMRAQLAVALPSVQALEGSAEAIPLPDASVDARGLRTGLPLVCQCVRDGGNRPRAAPRRPARAGMERAR